MEKGCTESSAKEPWATTLPPFFPGRGPISMRVSAARMMLSSCSTTTTVLPCETRWRRIPVRRSMSRACSPHRRLIKHEERIDEAGAEAGGEGGALRFAPGEGAGGAVESEVAQPHLLQKAQAREDGVEGRDRPACRRLSPLRLPSSREDRRRAAGKARAAGGPSTPRGGPLHSGDRRRKMDRARRRDISRGRRARASCRCCLRAT